MYRSKNRQQTEFPDFYLPFSGHLDPDNRWIALARLVLWELAEEIYHEGLCEDLGKVPASSNWKIIFHHEPGTRYSSLSHPFDGPGSAGISGYVEPVAFDANVDLIIRGHQHFYERTYPIHIRDGRRDDARGITMITTGGG